jgi:hypothetical protein
MLADILGRENFDYLCVAAKIKKCPNLPSTLPEVKQKV